MMDALDLLHNDVIDGAAAKLLNNLPHDEASKSSADAIAIYMLLKASGLTKAAEAYAAHSRGLRGVSEGAKS
jgi:hypothetical protein